MTLAAIFGFDGQIGWAQECARALVVTVYGLLLVRLAGRRVFAKWSALDIIVSIVVGSNLSRTLTGGAPLVGTLVATTLIMALHWALAWAATRSPRWADALEGAAVELSRDGRVEPERLSGHVISARDLMEALRQVGVASLDETRLVTLEPSGKITVLNGTKPP